MANVLQRRLKPYNGRAEVATTNVAVQFSTTTKLLVGMIVTSAAGNTNGIVIGGSGVVFLAATRTGLFMAASAQYTFDATGGNIMGARFVAGQWVFDLSQWYVNSTTTTYAVEILGMELV
jgi:hypothetical protein